MSSALDSDVLSGAIVKQEPHIAEPSPLGGGPSSAVAGSAPMVSPTSVATDGRQAAVIDESAGKASLASGTIPQIGNGSLLEIPLVPSESLRIPRPCLARSGSTASNATTQARSSQLSNGSTSRAAGSTPAKAQSLLDSIFRTMPPHIKSGQTEGQMEYIRNVLDQQKRKMEQGASATSVIGGSPIGPQNMISAGGAGPIQVSPPPELRSACTHVRALTRTEPAQSRIPSCSAVHLSPAASQLYHLCLSSANLWAQPHLPSTLHRMPE